LLIVRGSPDKSLKQFR